MEVLDKLKILSDAAKYDVSCCSSGSSRENTPDGIGAAASCGLCHSFAADGRCISLLKILMSNACIYDCQYCLNRISNDTPRATFTPEEIVDLTINFYKRNYIEGLFLSSAVIKNPDYTAEKMLEIVSILRHQHRFNGYIHVKAIPGASPELITQLGFLADRMSVNIELPSAKSLSEFAPQKTKQAIVRPMRLLQSGITQNKNELALYRHAPKFVPGGQSTQMIIGATPESDRQILTLSENLYQKFSLKRVYYSAYIPVGTNPLLPTTEPPLLREHRLYQADWLLRFYHFTADELLTEESPNFNPLLDPKCDWAVHHLEQFPVEINKAPYEMLLRIPGIGVISAKKIVKARRLGVLDFPDLKKLHISIKRAKYFITCKGKPYERMKFQEEFITQNLIADTSLAPRLAGCYEQTSMLAISTREEEVKCLTGNL